MSNADEQSCKRIINRLVGASEFNALLEKVQTLKYLQEIFAQAEPSLSKTCSIANWENGCLALAVRDSAWAARVRYSAPQLIKNLAIYQEFSGLKNIRCQVVMAQATNVKVKPNTIAKISAQNADLLTHVANNITDNALKTALLQLAKNC